MCQSDQSQKEMIHPPIHVESTPKTSVLFTGGRVNRDPRNPDQDQQGRRMKATHPSITSYSTQPPPASPLRVPENRRGTWSRSPHVHPTGIWLQYPDQTLCRPKVARSMRSPTNIPVTRRFLMGIWIQFLSIKTVTWGLVQPWLKPVQCMRRSSQTRMSTLKLTKEISELLEKKRFFLWTLAGTAHVMTVSNCKLENLFGEAWRFDSFLFGLSPLMSFILYSVFGCKIACDWQKINIDTFICTVCKPVYLILNLTSFSNHLHDHWFQLHWLNMDHLSSSQWRKPLILIYISYSCTVYK